MSGLDTRKAMAIGLFTFGVLDACPEARVEVRQDKHALIITSYRYINQQRFGEGRAWSFAGIECGLFSFQEEGFQIGQRLRLASESK